MNEIEITKHRHDGSSDAGSGYPYCSNLLTLIAQRGLCNGLVSVRPSVRLSVRLSVCLSHLGLSTAVAACGGASSSTAVSSECGQCHVYSGRIRTKLGLMLQQWRRVD